MLLGLDVARQAGVEVGALDHPLVRKSEGDIRYVDYADAGFLREKYRGDPGVVCAAIVETDAIWGERSMAEAIGGVGCLDYALASHVVEHVPDLVAWLGELHAVLRSGATLRLAVPDLRYTFDYRRQASDVADVLAAHVVGARAPLPGQLIDSILNHEVVDRAALWRGDVDAPRYAPRARVEHALACARLALAGGEYIDVHCWAFTPLSFLRLLEQLCALGFVRFGCVRCFATEAGEDEFIVILEAGEDRVACVESWRRAGDALAAEEGAAEEGAAEEGGAEREAAGGAVLGAVLGAMRGLEAVVERQSAELARLREGFVALERRAAPVSWVLRGVLARLRFGWRREDRG